MLRFLGRRLPQEANQRQGQFALLQVGAQRFAGGTLLAHQVEQIVGNLKGQAQVAAIAGQPFDDVLGHAAVQGPEPAAAGRSAPPFCRR